MPQPTKPPTDAFEIRTLAAGLSALVLLLTLDLERTSQTNRSSSIKTAVAALASAWAPMLTLVAGHAHPYTGSTSGPSWRRGFRRHAGGGLDAPRSTLWLFWCRS